MQYILIYNKESQRNSIVTDLHKEALENARQGDMINLYHYEKYYDTDEYRIIKMIRYNGNVKHIHLQDKE